VDYPELSEVAFSVDPAKWQRRAPEIAFDPSNDELMMIFVCLGVFCAHACPVSEGAARSVLLVVVGRRPCHWTSAARVLILIFQMTYIMATFTWEVKGASPLAPDVVVGVDRARSSLWLLSCCSCSC
jgi:hypothetical protein